ncbi:MAG: hypothetical protein FDX21_08210 [Chlorobium sp.]|nr:MAG: hypothetical protein FDX21_08210 [Chlorobium sp.]
MVIIIILLVVILLLLVAVVVLLVTDWPGRKNKEIEEMGREFRQELAQHRADSVQLLHALRIELDESMRETLENKLDSIAVLNRRSHNRRKNQVAAQAEDSMQTEVQAEESDEKSAEYDRQLGLFSVQPGKPRKREPQKDESRKEPPPDEEVFERMPSLSLDYDDIPDISELPDIDDL